MRHLDLFSGIGGFALAARNVGWETIGFCEIEPYCQKVLRKHWPDVPIYEDVRELKGGQVGPVDIITGGFPCQDISQAGKQAGIEGERSGLWSELARIIGEIRPQYAVLENVAALLSGDSGRWFQRVLGDLAEIGYDCEWHCIPASHVGAPHRRDRVWIIAYPKGELGNGSNNYTGERTQQQEISESGNSGGQGNVADTERLRRRQVVTSVISRATGERSASTPEHGSSAPGGSWWQFEPSVCRVVDGVRTGLDGYQGRVANKVPDRVQRLKGLGNAIVPAVAEVIFRSIIESEEK